MSWRIEQGAALDRLREMPDESIHCCITSPPYYGLRDYGTGEWEGGSSSCDHRGPIAGGTGASTLGAYANGLTQAMIENKVAQRQQQYRTECRKCGARRVDQQIGLEETPELFVEKLVAVFAEVRRVLRDDGTLWLNLGDSYAANRSYQVSDGKHPAHDYGQSNATRVPAGCKPKDLLGIPWLVAFALRADGWYLRSEIIWAKPNPMPESVTDRPTKAHEQVFLLSKSSRYFYDADSIRESDRGTDHRRNVHQEPSLEPSNGLLRRHGGLRTAEGRKGAGRNRRSVWEIATQPYPDAHFATFPPKLIEPMVLAGAAPQTCRECGAPWQRIVERTIAYEGEQIRDGGKGSTQLAGNSNLKSGPVITTNTTGWKPTCDHADGGGHSIVLDPFAGSGTTLQVAVTLGRHAVGIELNPDYIDLINARMSGVGDPLFASDGAA